MSIKCSDDFDRFFNCKQYPKTQVFSTRRLLWWDAPVINLEANLPAVGALSRMLFGWRFRASIEEPFNSSAANIIYHRENRFAWFIRTLMNELLRRKRSLQLRHHQLWAIKLIQKKLDCLTSRSLILDSINFHVASAPHSTKRAYKVCRLPKQTSWTL